MRPVLLSAALLALLAPAAAAQGHAGHDSAAHVQPRQTAPRPAGWAIRYDRANAVDSTFRFVEMAPGWHITTGPAAIVYEKGKTAAGDFGLEAELFLFPGERAEAFGVFVGGSDLEGEGQRYTYFVLRKTGEFLVRRREGAAVRDLVAWTAHAAIPKHEAAEGTVRYVLGVGAQGDSVRFTVNGAEVAALPRAAVMPDGAYGLRVNHMLDLHVTALGLAAR